MANEKEYIYVDSSNVEHKVALTKDDFALARKDEKIHDQKFKTKPTTFFKDALKRFSKNKSSVVGGIILGTLLLISFLLPVFDTNNIDAVHQYETFLAPKLFDKNAAGFWDGTEKKSGVACDINRSVDYGDGKTYYLPYEDTYPARAVSNLSPARSGYIETATTAANGGFANIAVTGASNMVYDEDIEVREQKSVVLLSPSYTFNSNFLYDLKIVYLDEKIDGFAQADFRVSFTYNYVNDEEATGELILKDYLDTEEVVKDTYNDGISNNAINILTYQDLMEKAKAIDSDIVEKGGIKEGQLKFTILPVVDASASSIALKSVEFTSDDETSYEFDKVSFTDANAMVLRRGSDEDYWTSTGVKSLYHGIGYVCDFTYDTYEAIYGNFEQTVSTATMKEYVEKGWLKDTFDPVDAYEEDFYDNLDNYFESIKTPLTDTYCPVVKIKRVIETSASGLKSYSFTCVVSGYKYRGYTSMPRYIMGTDKDGRDFIKVVFVGLRNSLLIGILTFAICFSFGLIFGAICGYFGGNVDIILQRFVDILSGVPWIVIMTLCILNLGSTFFVFVLAMCMTGWIGTSGLTRTQFYRFRDREYTLASRTLGASDIRLIFKHILPNAMGTIITSSVLMIPSVIFTEATISYLGLGFKNMTSLGVTLSTNQTYLTTVPILILFPSAVMALVMISFNLFGNGLRDAFNPSLKGSD